MQHPATEEALLVQCAAHRIIEPGIVLAAPGVKTEVAVDDVLANLDAQWSVVADPGIVGGLADDADMRAVSQQGGELCLQERIMGKDDEGLMAADCQGHLHVSGSDAIERAGPVALAMGPGQQNGGLWFPFRTKSIFSFHGTNLPKSESLLF